MRGEIIRRDARSCSAPKENPAQGRAPCLPAWGLQDHLSARLVCPLAAASSRSPARAGRQDLEGNSSIIKVTGAVETKGWVAAAAALFALL